MYGISKQFIYLLFSPIAISLLFILSASLMFLDTADFKVGAYLSILGFFFLLFFWLPFLPDLLLGFLENKYNTFPINKYDMKLVQEIKLIVILAGGYTLNPKIPITSQFSYHGLARLIEGIRLYRKTPNSKLILSGGGSRHELSAAELMAAMAGELGVPEHDIILESESRTTFEEAFKIHEIIHKEQFLLVTSANHMPRTMALFLNMGMNPVAAQAGHLKKKPSKIVWEIPTAHNLVKAELAFREYIKLLKEKLLKRI